MTPWRAHLPASTLSSAPSSSPNSLWGAYFHTHFTGGMAEAQRGEEMPVSHTSCQQRS